MFSDFTWRRIGREKFPLSLNIIAQTLELELDLDIICTFQKSDQSFLRIEFSDEERINQQFLRPYNPTTPTKIVIRNEGYKRFHPAKFANNGSMV